MQNKSSIVHKYFDIIYLVNLEQEQEKRLKSFLALKNKGITPTLWKATYGYESPYIEEFEQYKERELGTLFFAEFNDLEIKRNRGFIESPGAWGYIKTYEKLIQHSINNGHQKILILEDDVILDKDFEQKFQNFIQSIGNNWKILQLGASQYNWGSVPDLDIAQKQGYYTPHILHTCGSFAIGIDLSIGQELLENLSHMDAPFDHIPMGKIYEKYQQQCFVCFPNIALPDVRTSSIRGQRNQTEHSQKMKWVLDNFEFPLKKPHLTIIFDNAQCARKFNIGKSGIDKSLNISWLYNINGELRPIHDVNSPSLMITPDKHKKVNPDISSILANSLSDFIIKLNSKSDFNERELLIKVESLIIEDNIDNFFNIIEKSPLRDSGLVSIIVPTYKRSKNLANAIDSIIYQTYKNIEIIVVDDNNPNSEYKSDTGKLVTSLLKKDNRIKYISHPKNLNGAAARNTGIMSSKGNYICFLDDDDVYLPNKIEDCVKEIKKATSEIGGVYGGFLGWNSKTNDLERYKSGDLTYDLLSLNYKKHYLHTNTALYKKSALLTINGFDDSFKRHQDLELNLRFFQYYNIKAIPTIVAKLKPAPTPNSNQLFGEKLFDVKQKYLTKFHYIICQFNDAIQREIYNANWSEVKRHFENEILFYKKCILSSKDGLATVLLEDKETIKIISENLNLSKQIEDLKSDKEVLNIKIANNMTKIDELKLYRDNLLKQKEWYENTYESLPKFWKLVGAALKKFF